MNKGAAFKRRWLEGAKAISALYLSLSQAPFEQYEREFLGLQRKLLATSARTEWEQKETRRRIAEEILLGAWSLNSPWEDFGRALRRIRRLGYSNVERRFHVALLFARWARFHPDHLPAARRMLNVAEHHLLNPPSKDVPSKEVTRCLEFIREERASAPPPLSRSKGAPL
jgi:hypothetical protein